MEYILGYDCDGNEESLRKNQKNGPTNFGRGMRSPVIFSDVECLSTLVQYFGRRGGSGSRAC